MANGALILLYMVSEKNKDKRININVTSTNLLYLTKSKTL